jgi:hypothetical protein
MKLVSIEPAAAPHKLVATFEENGRQKKIKFGLKGAPNYTKGVPGVPAEDGTNDEERKRLYIIRHRAREDWTRPDTAGSLAYHLLWKEKSYPQALAAFRSRFQV